MVVIWSCVPFTNTSIRSYVPYRVPCSAATKRIREVRGEIQRALEMLPPGLVDVSGEVDVKYDSLLRLRYAPGIVYAGPGRKKGEGDPANEDGRNEYEFGGVVHSHRRFKSNPRVDTVSQRRLSPHNVSEPYE